MPSVIICNVQLFDMEQSILIQTEQGVEIRKAPIELVPELLVHYCKEFNINKICLFGNDEYIDFIVEKLNDKNYEIEVN